MRGLPLRSSRARRQRDLRARLRLGPGFQERDYHLRAKRHGGVYRTSSGRTIVSSDNIVRRAHKQDLATTRHQNMVPLTENKIDGPQVAQPGCVLAG